MLQNLQNFATFQKLQPDNVVDFEKCCKSVFACKDRRRYSRKGANFCRTFARSAEDSAPAHVEMAVTNRPVRSTRGSRNLDGLDPRDREADGTARKSAKLANLANIKHFANSNFANFWRARSRLYRNKILQENMRLTAFLKLYKICILLHRCNLKILENKSV